MWIKYSEGLYMTTPIKKVREIVFKRDNYTCHDCDSKENLVLHHKVHKYLLPFPERAYTFDEFGTLCQRCNIKPNNRGTKKLC